MNNEPVAWIPKGMTLAKPKDLTNCIPLYTHPVKELTDEKIEDLIDSVIPMILLGGRIFYRDFARAILRKAQEK
jgi:prolipoprotein diacylglyceryltransferase